MSVTLHYLKCFAYIFSILTQALPSFIISISHRRELKLRG